MDNPVMMSVSHCIADRFNDAYSLVTIYRLELSEKEKATSSRADKLIRDRAKVLKTAANKMAALEDVLRNHTSKLKQCIVYCENTDQLNDVKRVLDSVRMTSSYFHYDSKIPNRAETLRLFKQKDRNFVL